MPYGIFKQNTLNQIITTLTSPYSPTTLINQTMSPSDRIDSSVKWMTC